MARLHEDAGMPSRGARDAAALLPFAALALLMPPIILIFAKPAFVAGVPLVIIYIFGVWTAVVLATFLIARALQRREADLSEEAASAAARPGEDIPGDG